MIKYFDIHSHLDYVDYQKDFDLIIQKMNQFEIGTITVGTDLNSAKRAVALSEKHQNVWACIGIHPADSHTEIWQEEEFEKLVKSSKVVAIGECGLDFFRLPENPEGKQIEINRQKKLFEKQIEFAIKHDKTLMIHCRDIKNSYQAYYEIYEILKRYKIGEFSQKKFGQNLSSNLRVHLHFFAGDLEITKKFLELDATFSFTGVITFANQYNEIIKFLTIEKIMSETDSPFVAPVPYRGQRNEPAYVIEVVKKIAEIRNENFEKVKLQILENIQQTFKIKL